MKYLTDEDVKKIREKANSAIFNHEIMSERAEDCKLWSNHRWILECDGKELTSYGGEDYGAEILRSAIQEHLGVQVTARKEIYFYYCKPYRSSGSSGSSSCGCSSSS